MPIPALRSGLGGESCGILSVICGLARARIQPNLSHRYDGIIVSIILCYLGGWEGNRNDQPLEANWQLSPCCVTMSACETVIARDC